MITKGVQIAAGEMSMRDEQTPKAKFFHSLAYRWCRLHWDLHVSASKSNGSFEYENAMRNEYNHYQRQGDAN